MAEKYYKQPSYGVPSYKQDKVSHDYDSASAPEYSPSHYEESASSPYNSHKYLDESWPTAQPKVTYGHSYGMPVQKVMVKKSKNVYDPGYVAVNHLPKPMHYACRPIVCDPQYVVRDCYVPREVPVIHPIININRHVIVNVPKHYSQSSTKDVVVDPGCPG
jgi:hypothetical protein